MTRCLLSLRILRLSCISSSYRLSISIQSAGFMGSKPIVILYGPASQPVIQLSTETSRYNVNAFPRSVRATMAITWLHLLGVVVLGWLYSFCLADSRLGHMFSGRSCGIVNGGCGCCARTHFWHAPIASSNDGSRAATVHTTRKHSRS